MKGVRKELEVGLVKLARLGKGIRTALHALRPIRAFLFRSMIAAESPQSAPRGLLALGGEHLFWKGARKVLEVDLLKLARLGRGA